MDSIKFYKYHGCGNDFVIIEDYSNSFLSNHRRKIESICKPHYGVGADGLILIQHSEIADVKMRIFNPDGKEASMCGNGLRCIVKHLNRSCSVETITGICVASIKGELVKASLPIAEIISTSIPLPINQEGHLINTGTEHLIIFVDDLSASELKGLAEIYRHHEMFAPNGVNVNFVKIEEEDKVHIRTFEKGVEGETHSCGTGGAAVALAYNKVIKEQKRLRIISVNKHETIYTIDPHRIVWMIGPADFVFEGKFIPNKVLMH